VFSYVTALGVGCWFVGFFDTVLLSVTSIGVVVCVLVACRLCIGLVLLACSSRAAY
jgi:hypothetical protein